MKLKRFEGEHYAGYSFWCAGCGMRHMVNTEESDGKGRPVWGFNGDLERPVFTPSVLVWWDEGEERTPKRCHSFVGCNGAAPGQIIYLADCTHALAGQVIDLPDIPQHGERP